MLADTIRFFLSAAHAAVIVERMLLERKIAAVVAMGEARQMLGGRGASPATVLQRAKPIAHAH